MPYTVSKDTNACPSSKPWCVKKQTDGKVMGCHESKEKANAQVAALMASEAMAKKSEEVATKPSLPVQFRVGEFDRASVDLEKRTVRVAFSSEYPVERMGWFSGKKWVEILSHDAGAVRMERLKNGAAVLFNHRSDQMIGVVEEAEISPADKKGRATLRFGRGALASEKFQDVMDGILRHVSVGYIDHEVRQEKKSDSEADVWRVTDWEPLEISMVAAPADPSVGVGRDAPAYPVRMLDGQGREITDFRNPTALAAERERTMDPVNEERSAASAGDNGNGNGNAAAAAARVQLGAEDYSVVAADIVELGKKYKVDVEAMLRERCSLADAKERISDLYLARLKTQDGITAGFAQSTVEMMTDREKKDYSIARAIRSLCDERGCEAGLERAVSDNIAKRNKLSLRGNSIFVPTTLHPGRAKERGALDTKSGAGGGFTVPTELGEMIDLLRNRIMLVRMGARVLAGLQGDVAFPVKLSGATFYWVGENPGADVTESEIVWGQRAMTPKIGQATTAFSRKLLAQSSLDVEAEVRRDLADAHAIAVDSAGLNGTGEVNQPLGLLKTTGIGSVVGGTDGAVPDWTDIVDLETAIATANADVAAMAYLSTPGIRGLLKRTQKASSTTGEMIWLQQGNSPGVGDLNGYPAYVTNQVPSTLVKGSSGAVCHAIIFGDWSQLYIGEWGVLELLVDPFALKKQGLIEVTSYQMVDVIVKQPAGLAAMQDAKLS